MVEKPRCAGGACVDTGTIPSKTLREAVVFFSGLGGRFDRRRGLRAESRPSAPDLLSRVGDVVAREVEVVEDQLRRNDVDGAPRRGGLRRSPHAADPRRRRGSPGGTAERILVAVGTSPAPPPGVPADGEVVLTSDDVIRISRVPRTLVVVGGGVIGIEYASMFAALGVTVTLVERRDRPLEFLDREIVEELIHQMRNGT